MRTAQSTDPQPKTPADRGYSLGRLALMLPLVLAISACSSGNKGGSQAESSGQPSSGTASVQITADARAKAQQIFATRCAACHGVAGKGDGPGAANLTPKPPNFQDKAWQNSVTDQAIENVIVYGGAAAGKSPMMPGNPDLQSQPAVVAALREKVRQLGNGK